MQSSCPVSNRLPWLFGERGGVSLTAGRLLERLVYNGESDTHCERMGLEYQAEITVEEELQRLGPLRHVADVIVDYVVAQAHQSKSKFQRYGYEWTLEPDNWINLNFIYGRSKSNHIHVSLGVPPATLASLRGLEVKKGKWPSWSKITVASVLQLPAALHCIETAFYESKNKFRRKNGKPEKPKTT
jgi:hypothetical protein